MPLDINELKQCTVEVNQEVISSSVQGVIVQKDTAWVMAAHIGTLDLVSEACSSALAEALTPEQIRESSKGPHHQNQNQNQNSFYCQVCLHIQEIVLVSLVHKTTIYKR